MPKTSMLKKWLEFQKQRWEARRWIRTNGPAIAAYAMFHLNRHAKEHYGQRRLIYAAKNKLLRWLYQNGYCVQAIRKVQRMDCWNCHGTGEHYTGALCYKCGGSGVYRHHWLYEFTFDVDGRRYIWHQPESLVDWPVTAGNKGDIYRDGSRRSSPPLSEELALLYFAAVYEFLSIQSETDLPVLPTFRQSLRSDWLNSSFHRRLWRLRKHWRRDLRRRVDDITIPKEGQLVFTHLTWRLVRVDKVWYSSLGRYMVSGRAVSDGHYVDMLLDEAVPANPLRRFAKRWRDILLLPADGFSDDEIPF